MHSGRHYTIQEFLFWTRREIYVLVLLAIISTISRMIEIDLKEMLGGEKIPPARVPNHFIQM